MIRVKHDKFMTSTTRVEIGTMIDELIEIEKKAFVLLTQLKEEMELK